MAGDILRQYGRDSRQPQASKATCGGVLPGDSGDVNNYQRPFGPTNIYERQAPGLQGKNHGIVNGPDRSDSHGGKPGLGGKNHGCCGSQGKYK